MMRKGKRKLMAAVGLVPMVMGVSGCSSGSSGECEADWDCPAGQYCIDGVCIGPREEKVDDTRNDGGSNQPEDPAGDEVLRFAWGLGEDQLGLSEPDEGSLEGPMSFAVSGSGEIFVLDQVNERIVVLRDGAPVRTVSIPGPTFEDIELDWDGGIWLLDRSVRKSVVLLDPSGTMRSEVAVEGAGVPRGGLVTGMVLRDDGLWVEVFPNLIRIADASGGPDAARPSVEGLPSRDGRLQLSARLQGEREAVISVRPSGASGGETTLTASFSGKPEVLMGPFTDGAGRVYLGAHIVGEEDTLGDRVEVAVFEAGGASRGRTTLPSPSGAAEMFRTLRVTGEGVIYQLAAEENGAVIRRVEP